MPKVTALPLTVVIDIGVERALELAVQTPCGSADVNVTVQAVAAVIPVTLNTLSLPTAVPEPQVEAVGAEVLVSSVRPLLVSPVKPATAAVIVPVNVLVFDPLCVYPAEFVMAVVELVMPLVVIVGSTILNAPLDPLSANVSVVVGVVPVPIVGVAVIFAVVVAEPFQN